MAQGDAGAAGQDQPQQRVVRSADAPTTPLPRISSGAFPLAPAGRPSQGSPVPTREAGRKRGDRVLRVVSALVAVFTMIGAVLLVFTVFSTDRPDAANRGGGDRQGGNAAPGGVSSAVPSARPSPASAKPRATASPVVLPPVPARLNLTVYPGPGTPVASYTLDRTAGISYSRFGAPWRSSTLAPFAFAQRAGAVRMPPTMIGSLPYPGTVSGPLTTYAQYRVIATRAARWTLRYQPPGSKLSWTASQPVRRGMGWLLGYRVSYLDNGKRRSSTAIVAIVDTGAQKPAMLFATVADDRPALYRDLNMLYWTVAPI